jgi:hypothetical protein
MTTMRSVEPPTGLDLILSAIFPFLNGTPPQPGEHGTDRYGRIYVWRIEGGWQPTGRTREAWQIPRHENEPEAGG